MKTEIEENVVQAQTDENTSEASVEEAIEEEIEISVGDTVVNKEDSVEEAPWVKNLRKEHRELTKRNRELEEKAKAAEPAQVIRTLGDKPTLQSCDYETDRYENDLQVWFAKKREFDERESKAALEKENVQREWQSRLDTYQKSKSRMRLQDFEEAEAAVVSGLSKTQQGILLEASDNSAVLVYALGKNPEKIKELAAISNPIRFNAALVRWESQVKVTKKNVPQPDSSVPKGSGQFSENATLEKLRKEAMASGDLTKVISYKTEMKNKSRV